MQNIAALGLRAGGRDFHYEAPPSDVAAQIQLSSHAEIALSVQPTARFPMRTGLGNVPSVIFAYSVERDSPVRLSTSGRLRMLSAILIRSKAVSVCFGTWQFSL